LASLTRNYFTKLNGKSPGQFIGE